MKFKEIGKKIKEFDYKKLLNTKAFLVVGCIALVGVAILISTLVGKNGADTVDNESTKYLGNPVLVDTNISADDTVNSGGDADAVTGENYFAVAAINRQRVRDEAMDVLQEIADSPEALADAKDKALKDISAIMDDMAAEANIETLVKAKGFEECVAVISGGNCNIIVKSEGLLAAEVAQICEIVYEQCGILPKDVKLIEK